MGGLAAMLVAGGLSASPAHALGATIELSPGALMPVVANLGHATPSAAATAYAMKITGSAVPALKMAVLSAPANGKLAVEKVASNGAATVSDFTSTAAGAAAALGSTVSTDNIYVSGDVPGTYTARLFQDTNLNGQIDSPVEPVSEPITVTVADAGGTGTTATTADDVKLNLTAVPSVTAGLAIPLKVAYSTPLSLTAPLSLTDARGTGADGLGSALAGLTVVDVPAVAGLSAKVDQPSTYSPANGIGFTTDATTVPGNVGLRADLVPVLTSGDDDSTVAFAQKVVDVLSGAVTNVTKTLTIDPAPGQDETLKQVSPQRLLAKAGTTTTKLVGTLDDGSGDESGQSMVFGLVPGAGTLLKDLKANGFSLPSNGLISTTTGDDGQSTISVGSKALPGTSYFLTAASKGVTADLDAATPGNQPLTVSFAAPVPTSLSTLGDVTQVTGGTATLTGSVLDQWGAALKPATGDMTLKVLRDGAAITKQVPIGSDGTFSTTISDAAGNATSRADTYTWQLGALKTDPASISWGGTQAAGTVAITGIGSVTTTPVPSGTTFAVAVAPDATASPSPVSGVTNAVMVTGTVTGSGGTSLASAPFVMKATDGTYLMDAAGVAHETLVGLTSTTGKITDGTNQGVRALFTQSGPASISVSSGTASATTGTFTVAAPLATSDYQVEVDPLTLEPLGDAPVVARVLDGFGNPVPGASVDLSLPNDAAAEFSGDVTGLITDAAGEVSAVLSSVGSSGDTGDDGGEVGSGDDDSSGGGLDVTATINGGAVNPSAVTNLLGTGLAVVAGANEDTQSALVEATKLALSAPSVVSGLAKAVVTGTAPASSLVDVYAKRLGDGSYKFLQTVTADSAGTWKLTTPLTRTTSFVAKAGDVTSPADTTVLNTVADVSSTALGGGKVRLVVDGQPNVPGAVDVTLGGKKLVKGLKTDSDGDRTVVVKAPKGKKTFNVLFRAAGAGAKVAKETVTVK